MTITSDVLAHMERLAGEAELQLAHEGRSALGREDVPPWNDSTSDTHKTP